MKIEEILLENRTISAFLNDFQNEISILIQELKKCEIVFEEHFPQQNSKMWVQEYLFLSLESVISSIRQLSEGHLNAAGNTMRISYESLCIAMLLTSPSLISVGRGKNEKKINYYDSFIKNNRETKPHLAIETTIKNAQVLSLAQGDGWLKAAKDFYNGYSHSSMMAFSSIALISGKSIIGGGYNKEKRDIYSQHLEFIRRFLFQMPDIIIEISKRNLTRPSKGHA